MPDSNSASTIRTNADFSDARAYEQELKREIARAKVLGANYTEHEVRLQTVRSEIEKYLATRAPVEKSNSVRNAKASKASLADLMASLASGTVGFMRAGLGAAQNAAGFLSGRSESRKKTVSVAKAREPQSANTTPPAPAGNQAPPDEPDSQSVPAANPSPSLPASPGNQAAPGGTNSAATFQPPTGNGAPTQPAANDSSPVATGDFAAAATQTEALQSVGARMQAALEQNALITNSLFQQTLELLDGQNRKLGDVDRKISELTNQMKSLKNP